MSDLWSTASQDAEESDHRKLTATLRIEAVEYWPFLAEAESSADFGNRMALISPELDRIVRNRTDNAGTFTSARAELEASFERDFEVLASERYNTDSRGVRYVGKGRSAPESFKDPATCGSCGRTWDDGHVTGVTPAPSARCPFEYMTGHKGAKTAAEGDTSYGRAPECLWCGEKVTQDKGRKGWNGWRDKSGSGTCAGGKDPHEPWLDDSSPSRLDSIESSKTAVWEDECYGRCHCGNKKIPGEEKKPFGPRGRKWIPCERCLGTIKQTGSKTSAHDPVAYTYEADIHCPECAEKRFGPGAHGTDREGNEVGAVAPWDETSPEGEHCGTCGKEIAPAYHAGSKTAETFGDQYYDPNGKPCSVCGRGMDSLSEFPGDRCISCHANSPEGRAMPTADELSRMWGGPGVRSSKVYCPCGECGKPCEVVGKLASIYVCDECRGL